MSEKMSEKISEKISENSIDDLIIKTSNINLNTKKKHIKIIKKPTIPIVKDEPKDEPKDKLKEINKISNGKKAVEGGKKYEKDTHMIIINTYIDNKKFNIQNENELGGSSQKPDMICIYNNKNIMLELKNTIDSEFIQLDVCKKENEWKSSERSLHPKSVCERYEREINLQNNLFYGKLPPLNKTREEFDKWEHDFLNEKSKDEKYKNKKINKDYTWISRDKNFIKLNYKDKGCHYIQIKDYGLYHLGEDICNFNVPEFNPEFIKLRLRCKRRKGKNCTPSSLTLSAYPINLEKSIYSLDTIAKLPINLIYKNN